MHSHFSKFARRGLILAGATAVLSLAGCYTSGPERGGYRAAGPGSVIVQDDYLYYPGDEVYYNNTRHQYVYREGGAWVNRPQPPRGWIAGSASVHVNFHDAPEHHHAEMVRTYPKNWRPAQPAHPSQPDHPDDHHDNDHHN